MTRQAVLVTGGAGFIGSHLVTRWVDKEYSVRVVDNRSTGFRGKLKDVMDRIDFCEADIRDVQVCSQVMTDVGLAFQARHKLDDSGD